MSGEPSQAAPDLAAIRERASITGPRQLPICQRDRAVLFAEVQRLTATVQRVQRLADQWADVLDQLGKIMTTAQRNAHDHDRLELLIALTGATPSSLEDFRVTLLASPALPYPPERQQSPREHPLVQDHRGSGPHRVGRDHGPDHPPDRQ